MNKKNTEDPYGEIPQYMLIKGRYLTGALLGKGAYACVYRAYDTVLETECALKMFCPDCALSAEETDRQKKAFLQEAGSFFGNYEHPGVCAVTDVFEEEQKAYLVLEYLSGENLREYLKKQPKGRITLKQAEELLSPVAEAVVYLHSTGKIHGGICPEHLIFDGEGRLRLIGIGTCGFRSEKEASPGPWTDVFGMAGVFYECLTGKSREQAVGRYFHKGRWKPLHRYITIDSRTEQGIMNALEADLAEQYFDVISFFKNLGLDTGELEPFGGAILAQWEEAWLELTTSRAGQWSGQRSHFTKRKWKKLLTAAVVIFVALGSAGLTGSIYFYRHPETLLSLQIQHYRKEFETNPAQMISVDDPEHDKIWDAAVAEGERADLETETYQLKKEFFTERKLVTNVQEGFGLKKSHLKKAAELVLDTSMKKIQEGWEGTIAKASGDLQCLDIRAYETNTYEFPAEDQSGNLMIKSDAVSRRVESCRLEGGEKEIRKFLLQGLPYMIPETYITEEELDTVFHETEKEGHYLFDEHGKFSMSLSVYDGLSEEDPKIWNLSLESFMADGKNPEQEAYAGSYPRNSGRYKEFTEFVEKNAVSSTEKKDSSVYELTEEAVRQWNETSNVPLLDKTLDELTEHLSSLGYVLEEKQLEEKIFACDHGMGAWETQFCKRVTYKVGKNLNLRILYDILSGRIYMIGVMDINNKYENILPLSVDIALFVSEDMPDHKELLLENWSTSMKKVKIGNSSWSGCWADNYADMGCMVINPSKGEDLWFTIQRYGYTGVQSYANVCWPDP